MTTCVSSETRAGTIVTQLVRCLDGSNVSVTDRNSPLKCFILNFYRFSSGFIHIAVAIIECKVFTGYTKSKLGRHILTIQNQIVTIGRSLYINYISISCCCTSCCFVFLGCYDDDFQTVLQLCCIRYKCIIIRYGSSFRRYGNRTLCIECCTLYRCTDNCFAFCDTGYYTIFNTCISVTAFNTPNDSTGCIRRQNSCGQVNRRSCFYLCSCVKFNTRCRFLDVNKVVALLEFICSIVNGQLTITDNNVTSLHISKCLKRGGCITIVDTCTFVELKLILCISIFDENVHRTIIETLHVINDTLNIYIIVKIVSYTISGICDSLSNGIRICLIIADMSLRNFRSHVRYQMAVSIKFVGRIKFLQCTGYYYSCAGLYISQSFEWSTIQTIALVSLYLLTGCCTIGREVEGNISLCRKRCGID